MPNTRGNGAELSQANVTPSPVVQAGDMSMRTYSPGLLGVLGGMGPFATVDFLRKLLAATSATCDQEHMPVVVVSDPRLPDRSEAILNRQEEPVREAMQMGLARLLAAGATALAIPCNTAHHWVDRLALPENVPLLHIADAAIDALRTRVAPGSEVAILATPATLLSGMYQHRLFEAGYDPLVPPAAIVSASILPAIRAVKAGRNSSAPQLLTSTLQWMADADARACLLACTELPLTIDWNDTAGPTPIDTTMALAERCLSWWSTQQTPDLRA